MTPLGYAIVKTLHIVFMVAWFAGCVAGAAGLCLIAPDYGFGPLPPVAICLYLLAGALRFLLRWLRNRD